ncbi:MAG: ASKHA domain-containing protein [Planctomycetota bacterium]
MELKHCTVIIEPDGTRLKVEPGTTILAAVSSAGIALNTPCGGNGTCGNCRVRVIEGRAAPTDAECELLSERELADGFRLACRARVETDLVLSIPQKTRAFDQKILENGLCVPVELAPYVRRLELRLPVPSIADQRSDADRVLDAVESALRFRPHCDIQHVRHLPAMLRESDYSLAAVVAGDRLLGIERMDDGRGVFGAAFDIGTTTVVGFLLDLSTGKELAVASRTNPQVTHGDDVVSRIKHASRGLQQRDGLSRLIVECVNDILAELARKADVRLQDIFEVVFAGNTVMNHLLLGVDPTFLAQAPYVAALRQGMELTARDLRIAVSPHANVYSLPNIAAFVGGDTVGMILATGMARADDIRLSIDIGTNGEIVVGNREGLSCVSCAAGPAFEGARIAFGMRAAAGAIERVDIADGDLRLRTIGHEPPHGICGSGLVDALARLLELGLVDETGALVEDPAGLRVPDALKRRIALLDGQPSFFLALPDETSVHTGVYLTQRDIREVQLAKGAIAAGTRTLLHEMGLSLDDIAQFNVAGAFGNYIRASSAKVVGILPDVPTERIRFVGNAAGAGARMILMNAQLRKEAESLSRSTRYVELAGREDFQTTFMEAMLFAPVTTP